MDDGEKRAAAAASAGGGVIELGDKVFGVLPMSGPGWMAVRNEWRNQVLSAAKDPLVLVNEKVEAAAKAGRPFAPFVVEMMVKAAMGAAGRKEGKAEPTDAEILAQGESLDGGRFLVWYRLRQSDPTLSQQWVADQLPDLEAVYAVTEKLSRAEGLAELDPKKALPSG